MIAFITQVRAKPGKRDALRAINENMQAVTRQEEGVPVYIFHTAEDDPDEFYYYDLYESEESFEAHCQTEAYQHMIANIGDLADVILMKRIVPFGIIKSQPVDQ